MTHIAPNRSLSADPAPGIAPGLSNRSMPSSRRQDRLSLSQARRIALAAQGMLRDRPARPTMRHLQATVDRLAQFQIDSINVVARAHYLPLFSRLGPYDIDLLHRAAGQPPRRLFEYWGHEASLIDVRLQPALRWRMAEAADVAWGRIRLIQAERPDLVRFVRDELTERGPLTARQIEHDEQRSKTHWGWNWSEVKTCLEWLFWSGEISAAYRNAQFERVYDLTERVVPATIANSSAPARAEAELELVRRASQALGLGTPRCLADYFRMPVDRTRVAISRLVDSGELQPVTVDGWAERHCYLWHGARVPRHRATSPVDGGAGALVSPFDSLVFERRRLERLFGFQYRIEIYVPATQRQYGYYVYPFLLGERFAARVDLKADRGNRATPGSGVLRVRGAWLEPAAPAGPTAFALAAELVELARWLGLSGIVVADNGDLAPELRRCLARSAI